MLKNYKHFILTGIILVLSSIIFYITITKLDPFGEQKIVAYISFFVSFFCGLVSFFTFFCFFAHEIFVQRTLPFRYFLIALRRGFFFGVFAIFILLLQFFRLTGGIEIVLMLIFLLTLEILFLMKKK